MEQEQATPDNTGQEAPEQVQGQQPRVVENTPQPQQEAPRIAEKPDPDKRPPHKQREFKPEVADNFLEIPGAMDYLADKLGIKELQLKAAKAEVKALGFDDEEIADFGSTPEEIYKAAAIAAKYKAQIAQQAPPEATNTGAGHRQTPPQNTISREELRALSAEEIVRKMAEESLRH